MKKKCPICNEVKGKRRCRLHEMALVCPRCCATIRNADCRPCSYYDAAKKYQAEKYRKSSTRKQDFIIEIDEEVEKQVDQALAHIERKRLRRARRLLTPMLKTYPQNHHVNYGMGMFYVVNGQDEKALACLRKAVEIFPYFVEAHYNLGILYCRRADIANAANSLREVVHLAAPDDYMASEARRLLSSLEETLGQTVGVNLDDYVKAQKLFDEGFRLMHAGEPERAIAKFRSSLMFADCNPQPHGNLGICYAMLGKKQDAIKFFDRALEIDPHYEPALLNKAIVEKLAPGEKLNSKVKSVQYYADFRGKDRSYTQEFIDEMKSQSEDAGIKRNGVV